MSKNHGGPAFPARAENHSDETIYVLGQPVHGGESIYFLGMSVRDYFAAQWLKGYMANPNTPDMTTDKVAQHAYLMADAMLKEREK